MQFIIQKKLLLISILFFAFACFLSVFLYRNISDNEKTLERIEAEWRTEATHREDAEFLIRSIKSAENEKALLEAHFIKNPDIVPFLDLLEDSALEAKAEFEVASVNIMENSSSLVVEMKASGTFETIYKLLLLLENSPYELEFASVDIQNQNLNPQKIPASPGVGKTKKEIPQWEAVYKIRLLSFIL
ncbi:MAG: hypothetical protein UT09_C0017G0002 [Parcubacteria group bacterium GW2011_GWF2_38_8]|nr:MAG: hypothetical protein UT09_C0017G0002 [Parcubacteria group bacterium GW2011_GWF2_38_8]